MSCFTTLGERLKKRGRRFLTYESVKTVQVHIANYCVTLLNVMCCLIKASYPKVILTPILCQIQNLQVGGMFRGLQMCVIGYIVGVSILRNKGAVLRLLLPPHSFPL